MEPRSTSLRQLLQIDAVGKPEHVEIWLASLEH
jgi:hypothetical protein